MLASRKALLEGLIDYAGLFPPASLPLAEALTNEQRYRAGTEAWMLGRFICPAARLKELPERFTSPCSALGRGGETGSQLIQSLGVDLLDLSASSVPVEVLEVKLPLLPEQFDAIVQQVEQRLAATSLNVFFEVPWSEPDVLLALFRALRRSSRCGYKLRVGGLETAAFPSSSQLAFALVHGIASGRPGKATAGLHHPLPRWDNLVQARMHGFVNLFLAAVFVHAHALPGDVEQQADQVRQLLDEENPSAFVWTDEAIRWRNLIASTEQIRQARQRALVAFGSCSFEEPCEDLRSLGWL